MDYLKQAESYYTQVGAKNVEAVQNTLHPEVEFYGPLATLKGKEAVLQATTHFMNAIRSLTIRAKFSMGDQAMIVYDVDMPGISPNIPGASLLTFRNDQIIRVELFYDGSRFTEKRKEIFN